jgi:hypothetical protein
MKHKGLGAPFATACGLMSTHVLCCKRAVGSNGVRGANTNGKSNAASASDADKYSWPL